jgi:hypothetical protein
MVISLGWIVLVVEEDMMWELIALALFMLRMDISCPGVVQRFVKFVSGQYVAHTWSGLSSCGCVGGVVVFL